MDGDTSTPQNPAHSRSAEIKLSAFLEALSLTANVTESCKRAGFGRDYAYEVRGKDTNFARRWDSALEEACDRMELEARRRAVDGIPRLKFHQGIAILDPATGSPYIEYEYSDGLLTTLLKAHRPDKYRDRQEVEHKGDIGVSVVRIMRPANQPPLNDRGLMDAPNSPR
jgi:hypothetical protein